MRGDSREVVSAFTAYIGVDFEEVVADEGYVRLVLDTDGRHARAHGGLPAGEEGLPAAQAGVHEGVVMTMMDSALGMAIRLKRGAGVSERAPHATIEMNSSFLRQVAPGDRLIVEGRVTDIGESLARGEATATRASDGALVATGSLTFVIGRERR